jgi:hypothetical protein
MPGDLGECRRGKIWGLSVVKAKGNTVRRNAKIQESNIVAVPRELIAAQKKVVLSLDLFFISRYMFLITYSDKICFTTMSHVSTRAVGHYWPFFKQVCLQCTTRGFNIVVIRGDLEFGALRDLVGELPSRPRLDLAAENEHVGLIEHNIRFLKEKVRSLCHTLPFERLPPVMLVCMVQVVTPIMNVFPRSGGTHYSPSMIMTDSGLSMDQLRLKFGSYVQVAENQGLHIIMLEQKGPLLLVQ